MIGIAKDAREFKTWTEAAFQALIKKIDARLKPELVAVHTCEASDELWEDDAEGQKASNSGLNQLESRLSAQLSMHV